jgi:hypothetical protein
LFGRLWFADANGIESIDINTHTHRIALESSLMPERQPDIPDGNGAAVTAVTARS